MADDWTRLVCELAQARQANELLKRELQQLAAMKYPELDPDALKVARDAVAAQRERDAQVCEQRARMHWEIERGQEGDVMGHRAASIEANACAAAIRAQRDGD